MRQPQYVDLYDAGEDARIDAIGAAAMAGKRVAFVTDADPGKATRYIEKLKAKFPGVIVLTIFDGPVAGTVTVTVERGQ